MAEPRKIINQVLQEGRTYLMEHESKAVLEDLGISTSGSRVARSEDEAVKIFESLNSPVALKVLSPEVVHKSDAGGVKLNLNSAAQVRMAYQEITAAFLDKKIIGVSVQKMAEARGRGYCGCNYGRHIWADANVWSWRSLCRDSQGCLLPVHSHN